jgi:transketolase
MNGMAATEGFIPFGSTFLVFSRLHAADDPPRRAVAPAVVFVFTHDSLYLGEDGPTHQPVEHVWALRLIPNVDVIPPVRRRSSAPPRGRTRSPAPTAPR